MESKAFDEKASRDWTQSKQFLMVCAPVTWQLFASTQVPETRRLCFATGAYNPMVVRQRCPTLYIHLNLALDICGGLTQKPLG